MPSYDYRCKKCDSVVEVVHSMSSSPVVRCSSCGSPCVRVPSVPFLSTKTGGSVRGSRMMDSRKRDGEMMAELRRDLGLRDVQPIAGASVSEVYREAKAQASAIREDMARSREEAKKKTREQQREWHAKAMKRLPERAAVKRRYKQEQEAKKRAISL